MDFELTDEQKDITKAAREFAEKELPDIAQECDREEKAPDHLWKKACDLGFVGVFIPEAYGGPGLGYLEHCLIHEEFWRVDPGLGSFIMSTPFGSEMILLFGIEEQKKKWLPLIVRGEAITGAAITEPDAGSDAPRPCLPAGRHRAGHPADLPAKKHGGKGSKKKVETSAISVTMDQMRERIS